MNYKKAYKALNETKIIDEIIGDETRRGENLSEIKLEIINGIHYFIQFITESSFQKMGYCWHIPESLHQRVCQRVCRTLAQIQLDNMEKETVYFNYMIKALPKTTELA